MNIFKPILRLIARIRYPVSMPQDVASDLGIVLTKSLSFKEFIHNLANPQCRPTKLTRFMPREEAEQTFRLAIRKERFQQDSLFSYHFKDGWMEFILHFDDESRLRRLYICHKELKHKREMTISSE